MAGREDGEAEGVQAVTGGALAHAQGGVHLEGDHIWNLQGAAQA